MAKRTALSKKTRFEVFKRDKFTCQYCGQKAPDVVLVCDHIKPVVVGGAGELLNLVTACFGCNSGKGATQLSDDSVLVRQRAELNRLAERREQIGMMLEWSRGIAEIMDTTVQAVVHKVQDRAKGFSINENGRANIRKWLKTFTLTQLLDAVDTSVTHYLKRDQNENITHESFEEMFRKIPGIARIRSLPPEQKDLYYARGIARNRFRYIDEDLTIDLLRQAYAAGVEGEALKSLARRAHSWSDLCSELHKLIEAL